MAKNQKISVKEIKKEKKKIEKELSELVEEPENVEEIAKVAAAVPLPKGYSLKEAEISKEGEKEEEADEEEEFFLTATSPRRTSRFDDESEAVSRMSGQNGEEEEGEEKERKEKEKYGLPSEEEQQEETPSLDPHQVVSEMMQKGMFMDSEQIKMMGRRGERTRLNEMFEASEAKAGALPDAPAPTERISRDSMQARTYERAKEKERAKSEGKAFGKGKEGKYKSYKE